LHWSKLDGTRQRQRIFLRQRGAGAVARVAAACSAGTDHASLWFSLGVGLLVMQIGAYLVPAVGTRDAAHGDRAGLACIGAGLLAWTARAGAAKPAWRAPA
jgi:hypothetical protein